MAAVWRCVVDSRQAENTFFTRLTYIRSYTGGGLSYMPVTTNKNSPTTSCASSYPVHCWCLTCARELGVHCLHSKAAELSSLMSNLLFKANSNQKNLKNDTEYSVSCQPKRETFLSIYKNRTRRIWFDLFSSKSKKKTGGRHGEHDHLL